MCEFLIFNTQERYEKQKNFGNFSATFLKFRHFSATFEKNSNFWQLFETFIGNIFGIHRQLVAKPSNKQTSRSVSRIDTKNCGLSRGGLFSKRALLVHINIFRKMMTFILKNLACIKSEQRQTYIAANIDYLLFKCLGRNVINKTRRQHFICDPRELQKNREQIQLLAQCHFQNGAVAAFTPSSQPSLTLETEEYRLIFRMPYGFLR